MPCGINCGCNIGTNETLNRPCASRHADDVFAVCEIYVRLHEKRNISVGRAASLPAVDKHFWVLIHAFKLEQDMFRCRSLEGFLINIAVAGEKCSRAAAGIGRVAHFVQHRIVGQRHSLSIAEPVLIE